MPLCGAPGPYAIRRPTPSMPNRLEVLSCTRPRDHGGDRHQHAVTDIGVIAEWKRDGQMAFPELVQEGSRNGHADTV